MLFLLVVLKDYRSPHTSCVPILCSHFHCPQVCTGKMNLSDEVDLEDYVSRPDKVRVGGHSHVCRGYTQVRGIKPI